MPRLTLNLLGSPQVRLDGQAVRWTYDKVCALLIHLVPACAYARRLLELAPWGAGAPAVDVAAGAEWAA